MENEIMNYEEEVMAPEFEAETDRSGIGTVVAVAAGAAAMFLITKGIELGKKLWADRKAKKEETVVNEHDFVVPTDEEIKAVTQK